MKRNLTIIILIITLFGCSGDKSSSETIKISIRDEVTTFNPMYAFSSDEGEISELLYLQPVKHRWDDIKKLVPHPLLAKDWKWRDDQTLLLTLKDNLNWSDGKPLTVNDIIYSFELYSNPATRGKFVGVFSNYYTLENGTIDISKSFEVISDDSLIIKFRPESSPSLFDIDFPVLPKHYYSDVNIDSLEYSPKNLKPVSNGAYILKDNSNPLVLTLTPNKSSFLYSPEVKELEFKVSAEYNSSVLQLQNGEIDLLLNVQPEDLPKLETSGQLSKKVVTGRIYDFVGFSHINWAKFLKSGKIEKHPLYSNATFRKAIDLAINKNEIISEVMAGGATLCSSPVSPIFYDGALNTKHKHDPKAARKLLKTIGWSDSDNDGLLDKNGKNLTITFSYSASNTQIKSVGTFVQKYLKEAGIDARLNPLEYSVYIDKLTKRELDAWLGGWYIPVPLDLKGSWISNLKSDNFNFPGYINKDLDKLIDMYNSAQSLTDANDILDKLHTIFVNERPVIFLYWLNNVSMYNNRIEGIDINPLGSIHYCWEWKIK